MPAKLKIKTGGCTKIVLHWSPCYKYDKGYRTSVFVICKLLLHYLLYLVVSWQNNQRNHIRVVSGIYLCGSCALHTLQIQTSDYTHYVWNWFVMAHINYLEWGTIKKLKHNQDIYQIDVNLKSVITLAVMIPWDSQLGVCIRFWPQNLKGCQYVTYQTQIYQPVIWQIYGFQVRLVISIITSSDDS